MSLPNYHIINLKTGELDELQLILNNDMNFKRPMVLNLKSLNLDQQREVIGVTENYFTSNNLSFKYPYAVYLVSDHETSISKMPIIQDIKDLPKFFHQKDTKMNVKEAHVLGKNKLLQQELRNIDTQQAVTDLDSYRHIHKLIFQLEEERLFYSTILNRLIQDNKNG